MSCGAKLYINIPKASAAPDIPVTDYKGPVASISTLGPSVDAAAAEGGETLGQDGHEQDELHLKIFKSAASGIKNR